MLETWKYGALRIVEMEASVKRLCTLIDCLEDSEDVDVYYDVYYNDGELVAVESREG